MSLKEKARLHAKIIKRFEFYFDGANLKRDEFLQNEMKKDNGWVPLDILFAFNRLNQLTMDKSIIAAALKNSKIVEISKDNEKVRYNPAKPKITENSHEFIQEEKKIPTLYIKGFPSETTLDEIIEYLKPHGETVNVVMRRCKGNRIFKGSIFATFKDKKSTENFVKNDETRKFKDVEVIRIMQNYYWAKIPHSPVHFLKGQILHVSGLPPKNVDITSLKEFFNNYASVAYITYEEGSSEANIRFKSKEENAAIKVLEKIYEAAKEDNGKIQFQDQEIQCKVLESEEEKNYWADFQKNKSAKESRAHICLEKRRRDRGNCGNKNTDENENACNEKEIENSMIEKIENFKAEYNEFAQNLLDLSQILLEYNLIRKGAKQATKSLIHGNSELIILAADTKPIEIILHLLLLCEDKNIPYIFVKSADQLGHACGINRPVSTVTILNNKGFEGNLDAVVNISKNEKNSLILSSEALIQKKVHEARRVASENEIQSESRKKAIELVLKALNKKMDNATVALAERYIKKSSNLANNLNISITAADTNDCNLMVIQALTEIIQALNSQQ